MSQNTHPPLFWHGFFDLLKELHGLTRFLVCVYIKFIRDELLSSKKNV